MLKGRQPKRWCAIAVVLYRGMVEVGDFLLGLLFCP